MAAVIIIVVAMNEISVVVGDAVVTTNFNEVAVTGK